MGLFNKKKKNMKEENIFNSFKSNSNFENRSKTIDDIYKDLYGTGFDEYFKEFLKDINNGGYGGQYRTNYEYESHQHIQPKINNSIDNAYKLMKLDKTDDEKTIKKRYRELSMKWHPDKYQNDTEENQAIANRNFRKLNAAYELIKSSKNIK